MIGRVAERRSIAEGLAAARRHEPTVLTVVGEAGIGKTELLRHAAELARAGAPPFRVVTVRGDEFDAALPMTVLSGLVTALRGAMGAVAPTHRRVLDALLGRVTGSGDTPALVAALVDLLAVAATAERPLFVSCDDVHWLDPFSSRVLGMALRRLQTEPVVILLAGRSVPEPLSRQGRRLELRGLSAAECELALRDLAPDPSSREVAAELAVRTRGNALMLTEVTRLLTPAQLAGTDRLPDPLPIGDTGKAVVAPAVGPLPERTRRALAVVALAGQVSPVVVASALPLVGVELVDLDVAVTAGIIAARGWRFRHPLFAAAVVDDLDPADVRRVHRALATVLEATDVIRHADHLAAAAGGADETAASALQAAAELAARRGGVASAAHLWHQAAVLSPPGPVRTTRLLEAVEAQTAAGLRDLARAGLDELDSASLTHPQRARAARVRAALLPWSRTVARDVFELDRASVTLTASEPWAAAEISLHLALAGFSVGAADLVLRQAEQTIGFAAGHPTLLRVAELVRSIASTVFRGVRWQPETSPLADPAFRYHLVTELPHIGAGIAQGLIWFDEPALSVQLRGELIDHARRRGALGSLPYPLTTGAELAWWTGAWDEGRRTVAEAIDLAGLLGQDSLLGFAWSLVAIYAAATGDGDALAGALAHAEREATQSDTGPVRIYTARARLHAALAANRVGDAVEHGAAAHDAALDTGLIGLMQVPYLPEYVEAALLAGRTDAAALLTDLRARTDSSSPWGRSVVARLDAMTSPDDRTADTLFRTSLDLVSADRMPFEHARTLHRHGQRLLAAGQETLARRQLGRSIELYEALGARAWRDQSAAALRLAGGRARPAPRRSDRLSPQQERVVDLIAHGATNREAAARLFLSEKTIEYHVSTAMRAVGAANRTDLARRHLSGRAPRDVR